jgi:hypothetical protein
MIIEKSNGKFDIVVKNKYAQEVFEDFEDEEEARESYVHFHKFFNGEDVSAESIPIYERHPFMVNEYRRKR